MEYDLFNLNAIKHLVEYDFIVVPVGTTLAELLKEAEVTDFAYCFVADKQDHIIGYIPQRNLWQAAKQKRGLEADTPVLSLSLSCSSHLRLDSTLMAILKVWRQCGNTLYPVVDEEKVIGYVKIDKAKESLINAAIYA
ncbi:MAG: CBS domain-containing protein [Oligoflexales bacterium]|nr:CBS domain-containing protein [Oligoflexales bacterium]